MADPDWMGGVVYLRNLIYCLATLPDELRPDVRLVGVRDPSHPIARELCQHSFVGLHTLEGPKPRGHIAKFLRRLKSQYSPLFQPAPPTIDATYPTFGTPIAGAAAIYWMPDFQHRYLPHLFMANEVKKREIRMKTLAANRLVLVLSSEVARSDFARFYPAARAEVHVWSFCTVLTDYERGGADPRCKYGVPERFIYVPNHFWAHKNHITLFKALVRLKQSSPDVKVVCTGVEDDRRDPTHMARLRAFVTDNGLGSRIAFLGIVPRNDQIEILRRAALVLQPSLCEGWSTVIEDAKAVGRPIIASDLPVHREQLPDGQAEVPAEFFPAQDDARLADRIAGSWPRLAPGPDPERERKAAVRTRERSVVAGRKFSDIMRHAIAIQRQSR